MPIIVVEPTQQRGKQDAKRHRDKQREVIKPHLPGIITEEAIITKRKGKTFRVPIKSLDIPHFKPKSSENPAGIGQGPAKPGDVIGQVPTEKGQSGSGEGGNEPGQDDISTEIDIEEVIEMLFEDVGLPNLEEKDVKQIAVSCGYKFGGITRAGPWPLLERRATSKEGIKRFYSYLYALMVETKVDELTCFRALKQSGGVLSEALNLIKGVRITLADESVQPFPILATEDLRFRKIEEDITYVSQAVVIAMMDVSGSMGEEKKYLAHAALFWLVEFLRKLYEHVVIRFIIHHTSARIVDEETFFSTGESGGTVVSSAYRLALDLVETEYPSDSWNTYCIHFSDGDNYYSDNDEALFYVKKLLDAKINMFAYGEIDVDGRDKDSALWHYFKDRLALTEDINGDILTIVGDHNMPFLGVFIEGREDVYPALKAILNKTRWQS